MKNSNKLRTIPCILLCVVMTASLAGCGKPKATFEEYGSFTLDKTYSYDEKYYALLDNNDNMVVLTIYTADDVEVYSFEPCRTWDFWGICWEKDSYDIWVQSSDIGTLCYVLSDNEWVLDYDAEKPDYIVTRYELKHPDN